MLIAGNRGVRDPSMEPVFRTTGDEDLEPDRLVALPASKEPVLRKMGNPRSARSLPSSRCCFNGAGP